MKADDGSGSIFPCKYNGVDPEFQGECRGLGSVPVDFLRPKFRVAHTKDDVISILMHKYTYANMYIINKITSCRFFLC